MKVNMTPNPLDVVTIHASQGDSEARQWEFELHNNGELIDTSEITEQMFFKAYKGGTEQLLPENGSVPTTAPFLGDIKYTQGLLTDQEFTYRESPTEEDGLAFVEKIKGNTLNWNQIYNVNSDRTALGVNIKVVNGAVSITGTSNNIRTGPTFAWTDFKCVLGHKYIITKDFTLPTGDYIFDQYNLNSSTDITTVVFTVTNSGEYIIPQLRVAQSGVTYNINGHLCVFDLTKMFGQGNEPTSVKEFKSLFSLPYYDYNQGTLLSFNGTGLKTGGENLIDFSNLEIGKNWFKSSAVDRAIIEFAVEENKEYTISFDYSLNVSTALIVFRTGWNTGQISNISAGSAKEYTFTTPSNCKVVCVQFNARVSGFVLTQSDFYGFWNCALTDTFSTNTLPISTYFPTGMKSAGNVYDELTETKAINRLIKTVVDGTNKTASYYGVYQNHQLFYVDLFATTYRDYSNMANLISNHYSTSSTVEMDDKYIRYQAINNQPNIGRVYWNDDRYTSASAMNTALQSSPLEIVSMAQSETVETFSVASLVTENAEIPLSNNNGVLVGKCTEQLSAEPGFHNAKIKLADADGECYSNKIQLHVERKP